MQKHNISKYTKEYALSFLKRVIENKNAVFLILKENTFVGIIGIHTNDYNRKGEVWSWIGKEFRGKGITKEALGKIISYYFDEKKYVKITAEVFDFNIASQNLMKSLNFKEVGIKKKDAYRKDKFVDTIIYELIK